VTTQRIALVTCSAYPNLTSDDQVLASALRSRGADVLAADWRDRHFAWHSVDSAVLRSAWDYHLHADEFAQWIDHVAAVTRLINPAPLVRWNMNKRYLQDLGTRGVRVLPFLLTEPNAPLPYRELAVRRWREIVVKPVVGASAWQIIRTDVSHLERAITSELRNTGYIIQPYAREIEHGEYSLVFSGGEFSHAVLKKPRAGDFRTQHELGATRNVVDVDPAILIAASNVLRALPATPVYSRIDGILQNDRFVLMEAELIEPELYFLFAPAAAETFATLLMAQKK
jgi:glutathione synthase/RimK-type ligase-like ATP-grasp enzyme